MSTLKPENKVLTGYQETLIAAIAFQPADSLWVQEVFAAYARKDVMGIGHAMHTILSHHEKEVYRQEAKLQLSTEEEVSLWVEKYNNGEITQDELHLHLVKMLRK